MNQETAARDAGENDCSSKHAACATEPIVKKKIRAVQYGVGPIGAAIVRLMWEKESIEIIGRSIPIRPRQAKIWAMWWTDPMRHGAFR